MMAGDEPDGWRALWSTGDVRRGRLEGVIEARVHREGRTMAWMSAAQSLATVLILALVGRTMANHPDPFHVAWGGGVAILMAGAWTFLLINRRGVWSPYTESTHAFLQLMIERDRRRLRMIRVMSAIAGVHALFTAWLAWWGYRSRPGVPLHPADAVTYVGAVVLLLAVLAWAIWYRRRTLRDLARLEGLFALTE